jgi:hypothetical protein
MALCEQGYLCDVCGQEVELIDESDLYLRYVLGEVDPELLHVTQERHIRCNPTLAQFIVVEGFEPVMVEGFFAKAALDPRFVAEEEARVTRGYQRLLALPGSGLPLTEYPLPEVRSQWQDAPPADRRTGSPWMVESSRTASDPVPGHPS